MPRLASLILVLVVFAAPSRRVALALAGLPPPPPADADADAGRLAWLSLGDVPTTPNVCEGSFDASLNANAAACDVVTGSLLVSARLPRAFDDARLARVDGDVLVRDNAVETSLRGAFPALTRVGGDVVVDNTRLVYLAIFPALEEVGGGVFVLNNARVLRFGDGERAAFARLVRVGGDVVLANNAARTLDGACFPAARRVGGGVVVRDSPALTSIGDGGGVVVARAPEPPPFASLPPSPSCPWSLRPSLSPSLSSSLPSSSQRSCMRSSSSRPAGTASRCDVVSARPPESPNEPTSPCTRPAALKFMINNCIGTNSTTPAPGGVKGWPGWPAARARNPSLPRSRFSFWGL